MIETKDVGALFAFLVDDLTAQGYALDSRQPETEALLATVVDAVPANPTRRLELDFSPEEFAITLTELGTGAEFMWAGTSTQAAGLRLLLTHLDEQRAAGDLDAHRLRLTLTDGEPLLTPG